MKEQQDGLVIDNSVYMIDEKKKGFPLSARIFQFLVISMGCWSSISIFIEATALPVDIFSFNIAVLVTTAIMLGLCLIPYYDIVKQFFGALFYVLFFWSRLPRLQNGFYILENMVIDRISSYYGYQSSHYMTSELTAIADTTLLAIMILIPIVALLSVAIIRNKYVSLSSITLFLPVSMSFLFGLLPSEQYLIVYVISVLYLTKAGKSLHHTVDKEQRTLLHKINSRAAVWLSFLVILLFFIIKLFITPEEYDDITEIKDIKADFQTALFDLSIEDFAKSLTDFRMPGNNVSYGGLNGGELGKTGQVTFTNTEHLLITAPLSTISEGIYLKGYVGSVYTGDKWVGHSKQDKKKYEELLKLLPETQFQPVNQVNLLLNQVIMEGDSESKAVTMLDYQTPKYSILQGKMKIEYKAANKKFLYAPYYTNYELLEQANYELDLYSAPIKKQSNYEFDYFFDLTIGNPPTAFFSEWVGIPSTFTEYERLYREYVKETYTKLPVEGLERLKEDFQSSKVQTATNSIPERIEYVKSYLDQNTNYSLSPGELPKGKDYVEYFLYENKVGYCAHYASAATLMLRAMGIPARYVEGYAVGSIEALQSSESKMQLVTLHTDYGMQESLAVQAEIPVNDYNAHAWVEVYFNNCGWIPVEFTPGSSIEFSNSVIEELSLAEGYLSQGEDSKAIPTIIPEEPLEQENLNKNEQEASKITKENNNQSFQIDIRVFLFMGALFATLGAIYVIVRINKKRRARRTNNYNKKVILLFEEIEKILTSGRGFSKKGDRLEDNEEYVAEHCTYFDPETFKGCMETVRRARFGKGNITAQELMEVELFHRCLYQEVCLDLSVGRKIYLKLALFI